MYSLILLSVLAVIAPAFAAPNVEYSISVPGPTQAATVVSDSIAPEPTPLQIDELKRRVSTPAVLLDKRLTCPYSNYYSCGDGTCCENGSYCIGYGYCYNPTGDYNAELSSIMAQYTGADYSSIMDQYSSIYASILGLTATNAIANTGTAGHVTVTDTAYGSANTDTGYSTNSNVNTNSVNVGSSSSSSSSTKGKKKGTNIGMIIGIVIGVVVLIVGAIVVFCLIRRSKRKKVAAAAATAVQQPLMFQPPPQPLTPAPMQPPPAPYSPSPYDAYGGKQNNPYGYNTPAPPNTVEMPADQKLTGQPGQQPGHSAFQNGTQYTPPALPVAGIVEAGGESVHRPPSAATQRPYGSPPPAPPYSPPPMSTVNGSISEMSGQSTVSPQTTGGHVPSQHPPPPPPPPPPTQGMVYEMDSGHYRGA